MVGRVAEHVPKRRNPIGMDIPAHDRWLSVPICITCWLISIECTAQDWLRLFRGAHDRHRAEDREAAKVVRFRCDGCDRPMRVNGEAVRHWRGEIALTDRVCCKRCLTIARNRRTNASRKVEHAPKRCINPKCRKLFVPKRADAATCSNTCRQAMHRKRHRPRGRRKAS